MGPHVRGHRISFAAQLAAAWEQCMSWNPFKSASERELDDEMQFHIEKEIEANIAQGMDPAEARRAALIAFGGEQQTKENLRDLRWERVFTASWQDVRFGLRLLR